MKRKNIKQIISILLIFIFLMILILNESNNQIVIQNSKLYISEIMANNKFVLKDMDNEYSDYIEIYNDYDHEINLKNYFLSDEVTSNKKWTFPNIIIKPKEYLIIYTSGKDKCDLSIRECHTNFKLSSNGETISLLNNNGEVISKIKYPNVEEDTSYSKIDNNYFFTIPSPNAENLNIKVDRTDEKDIIINEVSAIGEEFIEIKNIKDTDIDLTNYSIKDKSGATYKFKNTKIKANSYLVLYGSDEASTQNGKIYLGFHIGNSNEIIYLYKNNKLIDSLEIGRLTSKVSRGRNENLESVLYEDITVGAKNSKKSYQGYASTPVFSINGGYVKSGTKITLTSKDNSEIYYTLDGSEPTNKSKKYTSGITITKNTVIKAISYKNGYLKSETESRTYLVGREHSLPVISIATNNSNLFGTNGIFSFGPDASNIYPYYGANFWKEIEIPISFEFYEEGELGISFNAGLKVYGGWSKGESQKSVAIYLREEYGVEEITYPFFEDNVNTFRRLVLRNSGQEYGKTKLKDAFLQEVLDGQMDIDKQDYQPVVVYFNGKYYGIYNIREKADANYIERHYGYDKDEIDLLTGNLSVVEGSNDEYKKLINYVKNNDMTTDEAYEYIDSQVDIQELINYWVVETYYGQTDPGNIKYYKTKDSKWRWILYDLDLTYKSTDIRWELPFSSEVLDHHYKMEVTLMSNIIKNPKIRQMYIETFAYHVKNTFNTERMYKILDRMVKEIEKEMPYHIDRWYSESIYTSQYTILSMDNWKNNLSLLKTDIKNRHQSVVNTIKEGLNLTDEEYKKYFTS